MSTLRIAHIADSHFDERNRLEDNIAVHRAFVYQARQAKVDLIVHAGDFFNRRSEPAERNALVGFLSAAADICPVVGVKGNHDVDGDLDLFNRLDTFTPVRILDRPTAAPGSAIHMTSFSFTPRPTYGIIALPWFDKANLVAQADATEDAASTTERTIQAARGLLTALRAEASRVAAEGSIPILVGHVLVAGSETSTGQTLIGTTVELSPGDLADVGCAYVALGHVHKAQSWGRVCYSGSPQRNNFGEPEAKGWNLVTIDTERWREPDGVTVEFRELPARRIVLLEVDWTQDPTPHQFTAGDYDGALVRFRYRIKADNVHLVDEAAISSSLYLGGAAEVKIEAVLEHAERVRAAAIVEARDTRAKVEAYWQAAGIEVPASTRERIWVKLNAIERRQRGEVAA